MRYRPETTWCNIYYVLETCCHIDTNLIDAPASITCLSRTCSSERLSLLCISVPGNLVRSIMLLGRSRESKEPNAAITKSDSVDDT